MSRLNALGYKSYKQYLGSTHWRDVKDRYRASDLPQDCHCCGHDEVDLHHTTYIRLGQEHLSDLVPLCRRCHTMVHVLERRGDIGLDLRGLLSPERAAQYATTRIKVSIPTQDRETRKRRLRGLTERAKYINATGGDINAALDLFESALAPIEDAGSQPSSCVSVR